MVSIVIRLKNEDEWLDRCLNAIYWQDYQKFEVIVVENEATEKSLAVAARYPVEVVSISNSDFTYGRALNLGFARARGEYVVCLSGHCIPTNNLWLTNLRRAFTDAHIAAVYGRQEPLPDSHIFDKRDLWYTFGTERKVQRKDSFFHNANSMIRRSVWEHIPFREELPGLEDRAFSHAVISAGYTVIYEPKASVYHHHGIFQEMEAERCRRTVNIIESLDAQHGYDLVADSSRK